MATHDLGLPSRALTRAASELGRHRRWMQERGNSGEGYLAYYSSRFANGKKLQPAEIARIYKNDLATLESLTATYDRLQAERSKARNS